MQTVEFPSLQVMLHLWPALAHEVPQKLPTLTMGVTTGKEVDEIWGAGVGTGAAVTFTVGAGVSVAVGAAVVEGGIGACVGVGWPVANTGAGVNFTVGAGVFATVGTTVAVGGVGAGVVVGWPISTIFTSAQFQNCSALL